MFRKVPKTAGRTDEREERNAMSRYSDFDDLDLDDEDLPLVEIEFDDEEDGKSRKAGTFLKVLLIILIVCALLAAGFFVVRYVLGQQSPKIDITSIVTPEPTMGTSSGSTAGTTGPADADQVQSGDAVTADGTSETVIPTPPPAPTPTPAPTPKPIPEQYVIDQENLQDLEGEIDRELSDLERQVLDLYITGMSVKEISAVLGRDEKSTDNAMQRIRNKLKKYLKKKG